MGRYKIIEYIKKGNMLVSRSEEEAIAIAIVIEQIVHRRTITEEMDSHIVNEVDQCGQVIFFYEDDTIYVSTNHLEGNLIAVNPFMYHEVEKHGDFSFVQLVETAQEFGDQIDAIEAMTGESLSDDESELLEELLTLNDEGNEDIKVQLEAMLAKVAEGDSLSYEVEINSIQDLLEEVYGNVNTSTQKQMS